MTTQHTHSEHSDADINVVEHAPVSEPETTLSSPQDVIVPSANEQRTQVDTPVEASSEDSQRIPQEEEQKIEQGIVNQGRQDVSTFEPVEQHANSPLSVEEEARPFTDFIEEFRQSEARFAASLQEYQSAPAVSETSTNDEAVVAPDVTPVATSSLEEALTAIPSVDKETEAVAVPPATRPVSPLLRPATPRRVPRHTTGRHHEEHPIEKVTLPPIPAETPETAPVEPVVAEPVQETPRPARRYRFDRPPKVNASTPATPPTTPPVATPQARTDENKDVPVRPNNGHMFNGQTSEKEIAVPQPVKQATAVPQQATEQITQKQPVAQEPSAVESATPPVVPATQEDRRRRHGQDRQRSKEQPTAAPVTVPTPAPVVEVEPAAATPVVPVVAQNDEVNPEDLPPLEYAELQKANSRRRRRRHSSSPVAPVAAASTPLAVTPKATVTPELPSAPVIATPTPALPPITVAPMATMPTPTTPVAMPRPLATPNAAVPPATPYSITSGYTVGQMNQNHEGKNPFMGPEPSPARGTMAAQNVRSLRTDAQRTPVYPVRPTEATSASVHQLANIVSAAIQTQTDRMVSELRRANQSPTNISVSMPPFPSNERVGVFVDVANLLYSARTLRMAVDFGKLLDFLRGNRRLIRAQAYCPTSPQPGDEQMFLQAVKGLGYRITTKNYKTFSSGAKKADLDLDLCMDVVRLVDGKAVDCIVLVSGDSDFMPMLDYCSDHGVRVEVAAFDEAMSGTLRQSCDLFINLSMLEEIRA
ncbi:MAG: NYN domain-containing protein [Ktedonobacteraceae bacterium]